MGWWIGCGHDEGDVTVQVGFPVSWGEVQTWWVLLLSAGYAWGELSLGCPSRAVLGRGAKYLVAVRWTLSGTRWMMVVTIGECREKNVKEGKDNNEIVNKCVSMDNFVTGFRPCHRN